MIRRILRAIYRYFRYNRKDDYLTEEWIQEFNAGYKTSVTVISVF